MPGGHIPEPGQSGATFRAAPGWGATMSPAFRLIRTELRKLDDKTFARELNERLKQVIDAHVVPDARQRAISQNVPHEVPGTIGSGMGKWGPYAKAGGKRAPAAGVFEGTRTGRDRRHPVFAPAEGRAIRTRGGGVRVIPARPRSEWTWVTQPRRPFLRPAMDANRDRVITEAWDVVRDVLARAGLRG